jgi:Protein of unknown function (DUF3311)
MSGAGSIAVLNCCTAALSSGGGNVCRIRQCGSVKETTMGPVRWLAVLPFIGILIGTPLLNRVEPMVLGMPLVLAWIVLWIVLTALIMTIIYRCDPANREDGP